jgi:hypothetical protein
MKSQFLRVIIGLACVLTAARLGAPQQTLGTAAGWRVADAVRYENLSVFPVLAAKPANTADFVTLDEALASGDAVITELGGGILRRSRDGREPESVRLPWPDVHPQASADVNRLVLVNRGSKPLLLLAGEIVRGGKQDRVVARDRIVPPGAEPLPLDVFCVERGRWSSGTAFTASGLIAHPSVREQAVVAGNQQAVWAAVRSGTTAEPAAEAAPETRPVIVASELSAVIGREARTESYAHIYKGSRIGQSVESFAAEVERRFARATEKLPDGRVVGVVVAYGGELAWADVFASAELFERYWPKLVRSYSVEALARHKSQEQAALEDAREFLKPLRGTVTTESEPGVYVWRQVREGRYVELVLEALAPRELTLHWVKIARTR